MARTEQIIIEVQVDLSDTEKQLGYVTKSIEDLKQRNNELRKQRKTDTENWATLTAELKKNELEIKNLQAAEKDLTGQIATATKANRVYGDSNNAVRAQVADLERQINSLSEEQKNSEGGKAMIKLQNELKAKMKASAEELGNYQDSVGDYTNGILKAVAILRQKRDALIKEKADLIESQKATEKNTKEYENLSAAIEKNKKELEDNDEKLKSQNKSFIENETGLQRVFGQYTPAIQSVQDFTKANGGLVGSFKAGGQAVAGFGKQLLALLANPIVAIIAAIVAAFMSLKKGLETNREGIDRLNQILAPFKALLQFILVQIGNFANLLLKGVQAISDFTMKVFSFIPAIKKMNSANQEAVRIEKELQRIRRAEITDMANDAVTERKIAELKKKMRMKDVYDEKQRLSFAREIDRLALEDANDDKKRAEQELQAFIDKKRLEGKYSQKQYTEAEYKEFAELVTKKESALTQYYERTSRSASMAATLEEEIRAENERKAEENAKKREEREKIRQEKERDYRIRTLAEFNTLLKNQVQGLKTALDAEALIIETATTNAGNKLNETLTDANKSATENYRNELQNKLDATIEGSNAELSARLEILDYQMMQELSAKELTERQKNKIVEKYTKIEADIRRETLQNQLSATANAFGQIQGLFEEGTRAAKITESAQVAINSISGAIAAFKSMAGIPVVGTVLGAAAAAGVIASGAAAIKKIWAVDEKNGAQSVSSPIQGVKGSGVGSTNTSALQTNVINPEQQTSINTKIATGTQYSGGFDYDMLAKAMAKQPAPVMAYSEFKDFEGRLATYNEQTKI